jgi:peroxiredoxin family protein/TusA-related sulfurtransferase
MQESIKPDHVLDVKGQRCPVPVLKTKIQFRKMKPGEILAVVATDPGSKKDLPAWAEKTGNLLLGSSENGDETYTFFLQRPADEPTPAPTPAPEGKTTGKAKQREMLLVCSKGSLDMAYPPLILATTAASMDVKVKLFFTFYGIDIINRKKYKNLQVAPLGNPAMPVSVPNMIGAMPGMTAMTTSMMKRMMAKGNVPTIEQLLRTAKDMGVELLACQMTMDVMGVKKEDLIDEVDATVGAAAFVAEALDADISMFV